MIASERTKGDEKYETDSKKLFWRNLQFLRTCISSSNKSHVVIHKLVISFSKYITSLVNIKKKRIYHKTIMCYYPKSNTSYISKGYALLFKNGISFYFYMLHYFISNVMWISYFWYVIKITQVISNSFTSSLSIIFASQIT